MALDSEWGGGKTTFLRMWAAHLRQEGFAVAEFNAWKTDFSGDPFVALSSRLKEQFDIAQPDSRGESAQRFADAAKRIARRALPVAVRIMSQGLLDSGSIEQVIADELSTYVNDRLEEFEEVEQSFSDFKQSLAEEASRLSALYDDRPLFVMIDELDRCRPSYAIELLEVAKHLFSVDRVVFVLAINRTQLAHSIRGLYGSEFDAPEYLHRFFDFDYTLSSPNRENFVLQALRDIEFDLQFNANTAIFEVVPAMIAKMLARSNLDLRRMEQAIRRLAIACAPLDSNSHKAAAVTSAAVIVREIDPSLYREFCAGSVDDKGLLDGLWSNGDLAGMQYTPEGYLFETIICNWWLEVERQAGREIQGWDASGLVKHLKAKRTAIHERANEARRGGVREEFTDEERRDIQRADVVVQAARDMYRVSYQLHLDTVIRRVECLP